MSWKYLNKTTVSKERMYQVIVAPVVTEKSTLGSEFNQVTFKVAKDASKPEIKAAIEGLFDVKVDGWAVVSVTRRRLFAWLKAIRSTSRPACKSTAEIEEAENGA